MPEARMQIAVEEGAFLSVLVKLIGARRILEVGTFTGYSSTAMALALPADGRIVCCDVSEEFTAVARRYWAEAGVADRVDLRLAPALETLEGLLQTDGARSFDLAFIDADKTNYRGYVEAALLLVRQGGVIAIDNVLWSGRVIDPEETDEDTQAIRDLNADLEDPSSPDQFDEHGEERTLLDGDLHACLGHGSRLLAKPGQDVGLADPVGDEVGVELVAEADRSLGHGAILAAGGGA
jgi:caffeoyl-CoA O-methyltransferase